MIDYVTHIAGKFTHNYQSRNGSDRIKAGREYRPSTNAISWRYVYS